MVGDDETGGAVMDTCKHCGGQLMHLKNEQIVELSVMRVKRVSFCRHCRRTSTKTEIYMLVRGVPLNAEMMKAKGKGRL